ncbi:transcription factor A, mitochondrial-like [Mytilus edulis]|uniref:transcription factor A, mitochondrial-like n=1 Tax=Mytilus edulis TaxID=6550 RepID=UPI0039EFA6D6
MALLATCAKSGTFAFSKCGVFKLCSSSYSIGLNINRNYVTKKEKIDIHSLPKAPKRPMTSYLEFYKNHYNEIVENNNLQADKKKASKAVQICSGMWESLDDVTRKGYQDRAHVRLEAYREEMKKFKDSLTAEQKELLKEAKKQIREEKIKKKEKKEEKQKNTEHGLPKRPLSSYMIFVNSKMPNPYSDKSATEFVQMLGHEWKEMSKQEKQSFEVLYAEAKEEYNLKMTEWVENMVEQGDGSDVKVSLLQKELEKLEVPKKNMGAYQIYRHQHKEGPLWSTLSDEEKEKWHKKAVKEQHRYEKEMEEWYQKIEDKGKTDFVEEVFELIKANKKKPTKK